MENEVEIIKKDDETVESTGRQRDGAKDGANQKIILFIIGVLVGAVIATAAFFVYAKTLGVGGSSGDSSSQQMQGGTPPEMPSGSSSSNSSNGQSGTPPEMPGNSNSNSSNSGNS